MFPTESPVDPEFDAKYQEQIAKLVAQALAPLNVAFKAGSRPPRMAMETALIRMFNHGYKQAATEVVQMAREAKQDATHTSH